ncbi:hypothetical protein L198_02221 [Cryptococcus wingfieldii CBS 7118]|uniref:Alpha-1,6-mannosyl-glycoprotein 6-beta-N-acetylglucosaminyltransferase n=1 Tax=Cryptococcus wingfieldii CBS 7118 TaxID=1295528 RepID=A0A1E3JRA1_9TREE|nr:hypothetical protein L198_02221 [Cryptococcus wingfieldii CBS 7118]ODO03375.1 hypothetical protein L198_02221 [Cryptococcus wingfieldii CBS 7118]
MLLVLTVFTLIAGIIDSAIGSDDVMERFNSWSTDKLDYLTLFGGGEVRACRGWDPAAPEWSDPAGCLKAKQYRQAFKVLERERSRKHNHYHFAIDHNIATLEVMLRCFLPTSDAEYTPCHEKPLIISGWWYTAAVLTDSTTGEVVWQRFITQQLEKLGYFWIAVGPYTNWIEVAEIMPDVYNTLWNNDVETLSCITDPRCIAKEDYVPTEGGEDLSVGVSDEERGVIPLWALNVVDYWGARPKEILHNTHWWGLKDPWPLPAGHHHLPYSMEEECLARPTTPLEERKDAGLILAKRSSYFHYHHVSPPELWTNLTQNDGVELISVANVEEGKPMPVGLETIGKQTVQDYTKLVGDVKAMVGIGIPVISPSVYAAWCQATPVVIPIFHDEDNSSPWHPYSDYSQHGPALSVGEPYAYSYHAKNYTQLVEAVHKAMSTPIERFIPDDMPLSHTMKALEAYMNRDLVKMMELKVKANGGKIPALKAGLRERCIELDRCMPELPPGRVPSGPSSFLLY